MVGKVLLPSEAPSQYSQLPPSNNTENTVNSPHIDLTWLKKQPGVTVDLKKDNDRVTNLDLNQDGEWTGTLKSLANQIVANTNKVWQRKKPMIKDERDLLDQELADLRHDLETLKP